MTYADQIKTVKDYVRLPFLYDHWYVAGFKDEFDRTPKARTLLERSLVFYRSEAGELLVFQNRCLHRSFPLSESKLEGDELVCRYHGIRYDTEGAVTRVPCQAHVPNRKLRKYPVKEVGPFVFIWMGEADDPRKEEKFVKLPFLEDPSFRTVSDVVELKSNYLLMQENLNDLTHFSYLHRDSFGIDDSFLDNERVIEKTPEGIHCKHIAYFDGPAAAQLPPDVHPMLEGQKLEKWDGGTAVSPGIFKGYAPVFYTDKDGKRAALESFVMHYLTPETRSTSHYWWSISNNYAIENDEYYAAVKQFANVGFEEDLWACENMQNLLDNDRIEFEEMVIAGDQAGMLFRKVMLDWVQTEHGAGPAD
ncbi:Rieske 2Fe-2S domain-containing protein [Henriciella marina]|uniref:Rieske 2Fe-2S domain-containing protein n=1 Tax=Henriciella marina TaxID=453851 RepID=A0ABT4LSB8_9PROT|nr:Rieske 2Fe-2S domain-containing protein [Henriciella marina]MCZ4296448.1 Rieske 2Fe-2S domain-containing protein [Henriciella marina]